VQAAQGLSRGEAGERLAGEYLKRLGYTVLERNWRCGVGEIDIIAGSEDTVVFVEVKAWRSYGAEDLRYAVDRRKQQRIRRCAADYLQKHREHRGSGVRFDLVFVGGDMDRIKHFQDAF
jgi:putative endonuclease